MASSSGKEHSEVGDYIPEEFKTFAIVKDCKDHKYRNTPSHLSVRTRMRITNEWHILKEKLPQHSVYVCAYEGRMDLLRALIIGDQGTPYHDSLFIFDFKFPDEYPNKPPQAHYQSFGKNLNPNLLECGTVLLRLLNTLDGNETDRWVPDESTVLQVLLDIKAKILNDMPYCNEVGREKTETNRDYIIAYNEEAFYGSCETMLALLEKPPKHFKHFIYDHFFRRRRYILDALLAYRSGKAEVGHYKPEIPNDGSSSSSSSSRPRSLRVHLTLCYVGLTGAELYNKLEKAFNDIEKELSQGLSDGDEGGMCSRCCDVIHGTWNGICQFRRMPFFQADREPLLQ